MTYPYNPDGNADGDIAVGDLQDFLVTYGNPFSPSEIMVGDSTLSGYLSALESRILELESGKYTFECIDFGNTPFCPAGLGYEEGIGLESPDGYHYRISYSSTLNNNFEALGPLWRKCATKCATKHRFLRLLSVLYGSFIVFINQSHSGGFCPSSGLIECEAKPQQALFADFLEGCKQTAYLCRPFQQRLKARGTFNGGIAQLARALAWHARGPGFESPYLHQQPATGIMILAP